MHRLRLTLDDISREAAELSRGRAGHLRIGTAPGLALHLMPTACEALLKEAPKVSLKMTIWDRTAMLACLRNGELDLAIGTIQTPHQVDLVEEHLYDED